MMEEIGATFPEYVLVWQRTTDHPSGSLLENSFHTESVHAFNKTVVNDTGNC